MVVVLAVGAFLGSTMGQWWPGGSGGGTGTGVVVAAGEKAEGSAPPGRRVRVEVLNGGGREGMALAATDRLRDRGFDVVYYGNAASFDHDTSVVLDRVREPDLARRVADALGIPTVRAEPDPNLYLEVSVVLGAEWEPPPAPARTTGDPGPAPWWDLRRFFRNDETPSPEAPRPTPPGRMVDPGSDEGR